METPGSESGPPTEVSIPSESAPAREDREVVAFLAAQLLPALGPRSSRTLRDAVRRAIREQRLVPLERLSGRHRTELLLAIEQVVETRRRVAPTVLVRLTTVVSATPTALDLVGASTARPAR